MQPDDNGRRDVELELLRDIASLPTAPFHEERVAARIGEHLRAWNIPYTVDRHGNVIAHYEHGPACRPLALMAHMDHPAFTIEGVGDRDGAHLTATLEGGVASACFQQPVAVRIFASRGGYAGDGATGRIVGYHRDENARSTALFIQLDAPSIADTIARGDFGIWDLPDFELRDSIIHARAIDDLVGCAAALATLRRLASERVETNVYGVFTRAEEVGLIGAYALLSDEELTRDTYIVSLEASKALPGALQGEGPVIRVGDRFTTFSDAAELPLKIAAHRLGSNVWQPTVTPTRAVQRQLMSGGRCEASAAIEYGYLATGMAFPLGNYHNMTEGIALAPENIHASDYLTGVALLQEAARLMPDLNRIRSEHLAARPNRQKSLQHLAKSAAQIEVAINS